MSTITVAKKDFKGVRRAKTLWLVTGLLVVFAGLLAWVAGDLPADHDRLEAARELFIVIALLMSFLLPIVVLVASYLAIAGERESGGIKFLLGLPNSRRDVYLGKLISRSLIVAVSTAVMFGVVVVLSLLRIGTIPGAVGLGIVALVAFYGVVFVAIAISLSAFVKTRSRAIASAVGAYFGLIIINLNIPVISVRRMVSFLHQDILGLSANPDLYNFIQYLSPIIAFRKAKNLVLPPELHAELFATSQPNLPVYLTDVFSLVILIGWFVLPLLVGYWRFERADLA